MFKQKHWLQDYPQLNKNLHWHFKDTRKISEFIYSSKRGDPVTMMIVMTAAATAVTTVSQIREGQQMAAAEKYSARVAEAQAGVIKTSAAFESETLRKQSEIEQAKVAREKAKMTSAQRATYAKAGVRIEEGTPLEVMADTAAQYELDLAAGRYNLATGLETIRYGAETKQAQLAAEAEYRRQLAKSYKTASYLKAGSTLLTGMSSMSSMSSMYGGTTSKTTSVPSSYGPSNLAG